MFTDILNFIGDLVEALDISVDREDRPDSPSSSIESSLEVLVQGIEESLKFFMEFIDEWC